MVDRKLWAENAGVGLHFQSMLIKSECKTKI